MATASPRPRTNDTTRAPTTRASVTRTKSSRRPRRLLKMRPQPGTMNGGTNHETISQATASARRPTTISRGKRKGARASSASTVPLPMAASGRIVGALPQKILAHGDDQLPALGLRDRLPRDVAREDRAVLRVVAQGERRRRLPGHRRIDALGLQLRARQRRAGLDDADVLAEDDALGPAVEGQDLILGRAHVGGDRAALEVGDLLDRGIGGGYPPRGEARGGGGGPRRPPPPPPLLSP